MSISPRLGKFLKDHGVSYTVVIHAPTPTASKTAELSHISGDRVAKGVVLKHDETFVLAVLPASHHIRIDEADGILGRMFELATESEIVELFPDCAAGAVPAIGEAYGLETLVESRLIGLPEIYIEGGDHKSVIALQGAQFDKLTADGRHGIFSRHD